MRCLRITPAQAGKSSWSEQRPTCPQDHPRAGGEKCKVCVSDYATLGSPPRRRGKADQTAEQLAQYGITPAQAGKRSEWNCQLTHTKDHPRAGGEKVRVELSADAYEGSPPRRRGKGGVSCPCGQCVGITPAQAGKSSSASTRAFFSRDHPRVGGEKDSDMKKKNAIPGSPPRRRGKGLGRRPGNDGPGITPA